MSVYRPNNDSLNNEIDEYSSISLSPIVNDNLLSLSTSNKPGLSITISTYSLDHFPQTPTQNKTKQQKKPLFLQDSADKNFFLFCGIGRTTITIERLEELLFGISVLLGFPAGNQLSCQIKKQQTFNHSIIIIPSENIGAATSQSRCSLHYK
ncbi:hypothetical protein [Microbulbifer variabilis]|uniref:hypothetical protein n=1 Tax=Microbulbifer variabilis TaxID=266805 RepID=UPI001CFD9A7A|nr:hypothetical protein [Microbulbifer variabilis]